jgi:hypothetical protein
MSSTGSCEKKPINWKTAKPGSNCTNEAECRGYYRSNFDRICLGEKCSTYVSSRGNRPGAPGAAK